MASFQTRGKRITVRVRVKPHPVSSKTFDLNEKRAAKEWAAEEEKRLRDLNRARAGLSVTGKTVGQLLAAWLELESVHHKGHEWEAKRIRRMMKELPIHRKLEDFGAEDAQAWVNESKSVRADPSIRREVNILSAAWSFGMDKKRRWVESNPWLDIDSLKTGKSRARVVEPFEVDLICRQLNHVEGPVHRNKSQTVAMCLLFALETGMRSGEIVRLQRSMIRGKSAILPDTKSGKEREVPLVRRAMELLSWMINDDSLFFPVEDKSRDVLFRRAVQAAGISNLRFHDSRHTAATRFGSSGMPFPDFLKMFGWSDWKMAMIYYNPTGEDMADRLDRLLSDDR